jgi:DUF971 family protein
MRPDDGPVSPEIEHGTQGFRRRPAGGGSLTPVPPGAARTAPCDDQRVTTQPVSASPTVAARIHADRTARTLEIDWQDGHRTVYDFLALRWLCPCAYCRGEAGMPGWLDTAPTLTDEQTRMVDIQLVGNYAVAPSWGDGHHTGYYTFALLRDRCPCGTCAAGRATATQGAVKGHGHEEHAP